MLCLGAPCTLLDPSEPTDELSRSLLEGFALLPSRVLLVCLLIVTLLKTSSNVFHSAIGGQPPFHPPNTVH